MPELCFLYCRSVEKELNDLKTLAAVHGVSIDGEKGKNVTSNHKKDSKPIFGDPSEYENLSKEERKKLTEQMMSKLKGFVSDPIKVASKGSI